MTTARPHVAYLLKRFPRISETFIAAELIELRRQGARVSVYALAKPAEPFIHRFINDLDVDVTYLTRRPLHQPLRTGSGVQELARRRPTALLATAGRATLPPSLARWRRLGQAAQLLRALRVGEVDHVHAHFASSAAKLAYLAWQLGGPTYSVTAHAKDIYHCDVDPDRLVEVLGSARFVATVSEDNVDHLRGLLDGRGRVHLVRNAVDLRRVRVHKRRPHAALVMTAARLVEKKGLGDLVTACHRVRQRGCAVRLEVIGNGPLRQQLEQQAAESGLDVVFRGAIDNDEVLASFARATVFALPCVVASTGDRDGLPTVVLEAMAAGVPVVTTGVNGLSEAVVNGRSGLQVPEHDPAALADALHRVLVDPDFAARLGQLGQAHVRSTFALQDSVATLRGLFDQTAQTTQTPPVLTGGPT